MMPTSLKNPPPILASRRRRLAAAVYDGLLLCALLFIASFVFISIAKDATAGWTRHVHQFYLFVVAGTYVVYCQTRSGQTLGMKTWRIAVQDYDGNIPDLRLALWRYPLAVAGWLSGVSLLWSLFDRDRQFLHDRLFSTRVVRVMTS
jgi:uncharacterized RDD family membrane protein YckC